MLACIIEDCTVLLVTLKILWEELKGLPALGIIFQAEAENACKITVYSRQVVDGYYYYYYYKRQIYTAVSKASRTGYKITKWINKQGHDKQIQLQVIWCVKQMGF